MKAQRAQRKIQFVLNHDQVRFWLQFVLRDQLPDRQPTQVHESFGLGQQHCLVPNLHSCRQRPALPVPDLNATLAGDAIYRQKAQVMRRELILDTWIAEANDQFHATIPSPEKDHVGTAAPSTSSGQALGCPAERSSASLATELLLLLFLALLLGLFGLLGRGLGPFFVRLS